MADVAWHALERDGYALQSRRSPSPPYIFSIEMISTGRGESILIHYGPPDATRLVLINGGTGQAFASSVGRRLQLLKRERFADKPVPIELFVATDQDEQKTGGLLRMLRQISSAAEPKDRLVELHRIWANIFESFGFRGEIRGLLEKLGIRLNDPFDHVVMRPERGSAVVELPDGLEVAILGPQPAHLEELYKLASRSDAANRARSRDQSAKTIESFPEEKFSRIKSSGSRKRLPQGPEINEDGHCLPSENAQVRADVAATDRSIANLASAVLLFSYRGRTFLHTGDSRGDLIMEALHSSGLTKEGERAHVSLLHLPHLGSNHNLTPEFLERVTADEYLFTGDGTFSAPRVETLAALIAARPCAEYTMYFVNRDSRVSASGQPNDPSRRAERSLTHGEMLDAFFAAEERYRPKYRRIFRATDQGSVIIDLLDRLTY